MPTTRDLLKLHFIVFLWGFTAVLGKLVHISSVEMVFYRSFLALLGIGALIVLSKGATFAIAKTDLIKVLLTGFIVGIHWLSFFGSGRISNPSTSLVGFATCSLWAALVEPLAKKRKISLVEVGLGLVVISGLVIIFSFNFQYKLGLLLAIISGLTAAMFSVINSKLVSRVHEFTITFYEMAGASLVVLLFMPIFTLFIGGDRPFTQLPSFSDWFYIALMAFACSVYAYTVSIDLSRRISVFLIQLTLNLEPVYGIVLALLIFGKQEVMSLNFYLGTLVILSAVLFYPMIKKRMSKLPVNNV
jgi:drug/metabolite transporter (DMT)-like permease